MIGGETSSTALGALFFYLARHPDCYRQLATEVRSKFTSGADIRSGSQLAGCRYLHACINETLRLAPSGPGTLWREMAEDDTEENGPLVIDGHVIRPGTQVGVCTYAIHHNEEYFPDPFAFKPERWMADDDSAIRTHPAFAPFSIGPRSCAGKTLAFMEVGITVAKVLWYFDFDRPSDNSNLGGGRLGRSGGRGRTDEFQLYDIFTTTFDGPELVFRTRGDFYRELEIATYAG